MTLIKQSAMKEIDEKLIINRNIQTPKLFDANKNEIQTYGFFYIRAEICNKEILIPCVAVKDEIGFPTDLLLGMNIMRYYKFHLNFNDSEIIIPQFGRVKMYFTGSVSINVIRNRSIHKSKPKMKVLFDQTLESNETKVIRCKILRSRNENFLFTPSNKFGEYTDYSVVSSDKNGNSAVMFINNSNEKLSISKGSSLGIIQPLDIAEIPENEILFTHSEVNEMKSEKEIMKEITPYLDTGEERFELLKILAKHRKAIALPGEKLGRTDLMEMSIRLTENSKPVALRPYKLAHSKEKHLDKEIDRLLSEGIITPTISPWSSPCLLVPKKMVLTVYA